MKLFLLTLAAATLQAQMAFYTLTPCRIVDTRPGQGTSGAFGPPTMSGMRIFPVQQSACLIPSTALAYALNITVVPHGPLGYLSIWPTGVSQPYVSTLNSPGNTVANAAFVPAGLNGAVSVYVSNPSDVILDINGYFAPIPSNSGGPAVVFVDQETPAGVIDGKNAVFTLAGIPNPPSSLLLFCNLPQKAGRDYTLAGNTITFAAIPQPGDTLLASYRK